jgi:hypothetical protein
MRCNVGERPQLRGYQHCENIRVVFSKSKLLPAVPQIHHTYIGMLRRTPRLCSSILYSVLCDAFVEAEAGGRCLQPNGDGDSE